jgi:hypothetical protein
VNNKTTNESVKRIYSRVFDDVYSRVKQYEMGILYQAIKIILEKEESHVKQEIYDRLNIKSDADITEDHNILKSLVDVIDDEYPHIKELSPNRFREFNREAKNKVDSIREKMSFRRNEREEIKMEGIKWIIIGACALVGVYFCIRYLDETKQQKQAQRQRSSQLVREDVPPPPPCPAALCLVVPAQIASTLKTNTNINVSNVAHLIDNASYFLCTIPEDANRHKQHLILTDEYISTDSQREVYVRISINDGRDLIGKNISYSLKKNLSPNAQFMVEQLACLRNLAGLEEFNRI